jgi:PTH1 family peptidyl-tRNA hydrolase
MFLVAGLGNPGPEYEKNRHNVGFMVVDSLAERWKAGALRDKFRGRFVKTAHRGVDVVLLEPLTYMNLSGESVQKAMAFFKVPLERVIVVHDELDLPFGQVRIKVGGGAAGHNGIKSVTQVCGGPAFLRIRVGIDGERRGGGEDYVLSDFSAAERAELPDVLDLAARCVEGIVTDGAEKAMNRLHAPR